MRVPGATPADSASQFRALVRRVTEPLGAFLLLLLRQLLGHLLLLRIETEHRWLAGKKIIGIADPAIWDAEFGVSIADVAAKHQVFFQKGDHKRIPGWMQVHYRLAFDDQGFPMMYIFRNCKAFIRTMPLLQYDDHRPEDLDTDGEDHVADEVRYFCMMRPIISGLLRMLPSLLSKSSMGVPQLLNQLPYFRGS